MSINSIQVSFLHAVLPLVIVGVCAGAGHKYYISEV